MNELNKYILHHLLQNGVLKFCDAPELIAKIAGKLSVEIKDLKSIVTKINENISKHSLRVDIRICEISGEKVCVLVNQTIDDLCTTLINKTPVEFELLDVIFKEIMSSNPKKVSSISCLNLTSQLKGNISKDHAQNKIDNWFENGYLINDNGTVYLGPRAISEFQQYFIIQFAKVMTTCQLCTDYVYFGKICASCNEVLHKHCISKHLSKTDTCPICKKKWVEAPERSNEDDDSSNDGESPDESMDTD